LTPRVPRVYESCR